MTNFKTFTTTGRRGIDDLIPEDPYHHTDWHSTYHGKFGVTEEQYKANPEAYSKLVQEHNQNYIVELTMAGDYGKEYHRNFNFQSIPEFDQPTSGDMDNFGLLIPKGIMHHTDRKSSDTVRPIEYPHLIQELLDLKPTTHIETPEPPQTKFIIGIDPYQQKDGTISKGGMFTHDCKYKNMSNEEFNKEMDERTEHFKLDTSEEIVKVTVDFRPCPRIFHDRISYKYWTLLPLSDKDTLIKAADILNRRLK